jgi:23S rRNA-/tRNA-specific pseudouridylate synthase
LLPTRGEEGASGRGRDEEWSGKVRRKGFASFRASMSMPAVGGGSRAKAKARARARMNEFLKGEEDEAKWSCPACGQFTRLPERLARHIYSCCPELVVSNSPQFEQAQKALSCSPSLEEEEERMQKTETQQEAKRHEVTWRQLRARPKSQGKLSEKELKATMDAIDFAKRRESVILAAATHIAFYSPHMSTSDQKVGNEEEGDPDPDQLRKTMQEVSVNTPIPLSERVQRVCDQLNLKYDRVHLLLKRKIKAEPLVADAEPLEVIYEDDDWLCVNKPPLLRTAPRHRFEGKSLVNRAIGHVQRQKNKKKNSNSTTPTTGNNSAKNDSKPYVLHRLDMDTSGCVLFAKRQELASFVQTQFRERTVKKHYLAICYGNPPDCFVVADALERKTDHDIAMKISDPNNKNGSEASKPAKTLFVTISRREICHQPRGRIPIDWELSELHPYVANSLISAEEWTARSKEDVFLVCAIPLSGRTHQIRLHLAHAGFPIIGDPLYGMGGKIKINDNSNEEEELMKRQALHAFKLQLEGPPAPVKEGEAEDGVGDVDGSSSSKGKKLSFLAPLPEDMKKCLELLNIEDKEIRTINEIIQGRMEYFSSQ